ncbi:MAG: hypothetical protein ABIM49_03805 [candidate division WOR-3 bacterium]
MDIKEYSVVFVADRGSLSSRIIEFYQRVKNFIFDAPVPTHTEFYLHNGITISADAVGVRRNKLKRLLKGKRKVWIIELDLKYQFDKDLIETFLISQIGRPYDFKAIIWFATKFPILGRIIAKIIRLIFKKNIQPDKYAYFCSELVLRALQQIGLLTHLDPEKTTPYELFENLKIYYKEKVIYDNIKNP